MKEYQSAFISFLMHSGVLTFGDFTTKSGRRTPYFINTGNFNTGERLAQVGSWYAKHIVESGLASSDIIFGPAYKGIPLAVSTGVALATEHGCSRGITFDRKEIKTHGDKGALVGSPIAAGNKVILVEDVVTAGTTLKEIVPRLRADYAAEIAGVIIAVDRAERGAGKETAVVELARELEIVIYPLVSIHDIVAYLEQANLVELNLPETIIDSIKGYLTQYGA